MSNEYIESEEFLEVTFEMPAIFDTEKLAQTIMNDYPTAVNIRIILGKIKIEPRRLVKKRNDYSYRIYKTKHISLIKDCAHDPKYTGVLPCNDCKREGDKK